MAVTRRLVFSDLKLRGRLGAVATDTDAATDGDKTSAVVGACTDADADAFAGPDESIKELYSSMTLFWDSESQGSAVYAACMYVATAALTLRRREQ